MAQTPGPDANAASLLIDGKAGEAAAAGTTGPTGRGQSFWQTTKGRIVLILSALAVLALALGLSLGLTVGRQNSCNPAGGGGGGTDANGSEGGDGEPKDGDVDTVPDDEYTKNWKKPQNLATYEGWFPSPRGGSEPKWAQAYAKAAEMVGRMSLLEKVNVTTGTGWQMVSTLSIWPPDQASGFPLHEEQNCFPVVSVIHTVPYVGRRS